VLLKNDKNVLPLSKEIHSIAVIGPNGVRGITVLEGIKNKLGVGVGRLYNG
jgi:beta-glucosidase-like glycosyl hydrolase